MHDPLVVAFEVKRPWPGVTWPTGKKVTVYWPAFVTVWHREPGGVDSGTICKWSGHWRWHVHHWRLQVHPLQDLRRRLLTRCEWCGGRQGKRDAVDHSLQWEREDTPWWRGERGLYHHDCATVQTAHRTCTCEEPWLLREGGVCTMCDRFRRYGGLPENIRLMYRELSEIPEGTRDRARYLAAMEAPL